MHAEDTAGSTTFERKKWIDLLRGLAMLLVIWGHIAKTEELFFVLVNPFKIPLFFAISGYLFVAHGGNTKQFLRQLFITIIVPWFMLSLVWLKPFYAMWIGRPDMIPNYFYNFLSGNTLWFMPCLIIAEIILFLIRKYAPSVSLQYLLMTVITLIGLVLAHFGKGNFAMFNVACVSQAFFLFGDWFKNSEETLRNLFSGWRSLLPGVLYGTLIICNLMLYPGQSMDVHLCRYHNYFLCAGLIFFSLLFLFVNAPAVEYIFRWIPFVGKNTLVFYIFHYYVRAVFIKGMKMIGIPLPENVIGYAALFLFVCAVLSVLSLMINRWVPFIAGGKRYRNQKLPA